MDVAVLDGLINDCTVVLDPEDVTQDGLVVGDMHYFRVGVDIVKAEIARPTLEALLSDYPEPDRLAKGLSYQELGSFLGDNDAALRLIALGGVLGLWDVSTPAVHGHEGDVAEQKAEAGEIWLTGWSPGLPQIEVASDDVEEV